MKLILEHYGWLHGGSYLNDPQSFWMARPITINAIAAAYVVVAFSGIWWSSLWRSAAYVRIWAGVMSAFAIIYSGIYGWFFYAPEKSVVPWQGFLAFGTLPAAVALTVIAAYRLTRRNRTDLAVGWPVSTWFWWLLPTGLAMSFALSALLVFVPLAQSKCATCNQMMVLVVAHGINGFVLGLTLRLMTWAFRLIPDANRPVVAGRARPTQHGSLQSPEV